MPKISRRYLRFFFYCATNSNPYYAKAFTFESLLNTHLEVLSALERNMDSIDKKLETIKESFDKVPLLNKAKANQPKSNKSISKTLCGP